MAPAELVDLWPLLVRVGRMRAGFPFVALLGWYVVEPVISCTVRRRNRTTPTIQEAISRYVRLLVLAHLRAAAAECDGVRDDPSPAAYVDEFGGDAVIVRVHYWVDDPRRRDPLAVRSAYARAVKERLDRAGIATGPASKRELRGRIEVDDPGSTPSWTGE